jgi:uncharacterized C2H2 Zn-finger protein
MWAPLTTYKKPLTKEEEKQEFDSIYQLLQSMVRKPAEPSQPVEVLEVSPPAPPLLITHEPIIEHDMTTFPLSTSDDLFQSSEFDKPAVPSPKKEQTNIVVQPPKKPRGRPKKVQPESARGMRCVSCKESFQKNSDYLLHFDTAPLCMRAHSSPYPFQPRHPITQSLYTTVHEWLTKAIATEENDTQCRHCGSPFKNAQNLYRHLSTSHPCNQLAHIEIKKIVSEF